MSEFPHIPTNSLVWVRFSSHANDFDDLALLKTELRSLLGKKARVLLGTNSTKHSLEFRSHDDYSDTAKIAVRFFFRTRHIDAISLAL